MAVDNDDLDDVRLEGQRIRVLDPDVRIEARGPPGDLDRIVVVGGEDPLGRPLGELQQPRDPLATTVAGT